MSVMNVMRKAIESMYIGVCDVVEHQKVTDPLTKKTGFEEVPVILAQPCRVSFKTSSSSGDGNASAITQEIKLFVSPDITIKEGSKINVTQNGVKTSYSNSGVPARYETHQEITLKLFDRWA